MTDNANEVVTLGGTLLAEGADEKNVNAFTWNGEMKGRAPSVSDAEGRSSPAGREWQKRHATAESVRDVPNAPVGILRRPDDGASPEGERH